MIPENKYDRGINQMLKQLLREHGPCRSAELLHKLPKYKRMLTSGGIGYRLRIMMLRGEPIQRESVKSGTGGRVWRWSVKK